MHQLESRQSTGHSFSFDEVRKCHFISQSFVQKSHFYFKEKNQLSKLSNPMKCISRYSFLNQPLLFYI